MPRKMLLFLSIAGVVLLSPVPALADSAPAEPFPFDPESEVVVGQRDGLVTLEAIRFKVSETKLSATALIACDKGKDQKLDLQLTLLDGDGKQVAVLTAKGKVEEKHKGKVKFSKKLGAEILESVESFEVALWTYPD